MVKWVLVGFWWLVGRRRKQTPSASTTSEQVARALVILLLKLLRSAVVFDVVVFLGLQLVGWLFWLLFNFIVGKTTGTVKGVRVLRDLHLARIQDVHFVGASFYDGS